MLKVLLPIVFAASVQQVSVSAVPARIDEAEEFQAAVVFSCPSCTTDSFLRGVFYPSGTGYFGYTKNEKGEWVNGPSSSCTSYFHLSASESGEASWSGTMSFKPDRESGFYKGPGEYLFKVGRYTPSCSSASVWSEEIPIVLTGPTVTPAPTQTPKPENTATPVPESSSPTVSVPTPTNAPVRVGLIRSDESDTPDILGSEDTLSVVASPSGYSAPARRIPKHVFVLLCMSIGCFCIGGALSVWKKRQSSSV